MAQKPLAAGACFLTIHAALLQDRLTTQRPLSRRPWMACQGSCCTPSSSTLHRSEGMLHRPRLIIRWQLCHVCAGFWFQLVLILRSDGCVAAGAQCGAEGARPADGLRRGAGRGPHAGQCVAHAAGVRPPGARVCAQVRALASALLSNKQPHSFKLGSAHMRDAGKAREHAAS